MRALAAAGHEIVVVVTRPDKRRGRGTATSPSPVKAAAHDLGLTVTERVDDVVGSGAELGVVVAYGRIIPGRVLAVLPMVNLHFSLLPRWRGAAPVERAILAGDEETGVCVMAVDEGLDTGAVYACESVPMDHDDLATLRGRLVQAGTRLLLDVVARGVEGLPAPVPQSGTPTYAEKIDPNELELRFDEPAEQLARVVRLGRAWTRFRGRRLRVLRAQAVDAADAVNAVDGSSPGAVPSELVPGVIVRDRVMTSRGALRLLRVQPDGRAPMDANAWLRGARPASGERLG